jgi:hypothetical protein
MQSKPRILIVDIHIVGTHAKNRFERLPTHLLIAWSSAR